MYLPPAFREDRVDILHEFMLRHSFATVVTNGPEGLIASHIPLVLDPTPAPLGTLRGHLARGNPQWSTSDPAAAALVLFQGPHHYVSPSWYPSRLDHGRVVPTWNYLAVHAYGPLRITDDPEYVRRNVADLTRIHEAGLLEPWSVDNSPQEFIDGMLKGIVGIEIPIERLEGKWKLNQNRPQADRAAVERTLRALGSSAALAVADAMAKFSL